MRLKTIPMTRSVMLLISIAIYLANGWGSSTFAQSGTPTLPTEKEISSAIEAIKQVGKDGVGNKAAAAAMPTLNRVQSSQIPLLLEAFNGSSPLQRNWLMGPINRLVDRAETDLPKQAIADYFSDESNDGEGRFVAFELLTRDDKPLSQRMIPEMLDDPSLPLRHMAIADLIQQATQLKDDQDKPAAIALLDEALTNAIDVDQLQAIAKELKAKGSKVNLREVMGFVSQWQIVAGFDNTQSKGFDVPHGPELDVTSVDLKATYKDASQQAVQWTQYTTDSDTGVFDLNKLIGNEKDRTAYAYTVFNSPVAGTAEVRIGTPNAHKIWVNGKLVMSNEIYHNSNSIDKFVSQVDLVEGSNEVLVKLCQNNQTQAWAQDWQFQLRLCGEDSKPILPPSP